MEQNEQNEQRNPTSRYYRMEFQPDRMASFDRKIRATGLILCALCVLIGIISSGDNSISISESLIDSDRKATIESDVVEEVNAQEPVQESIDHSTLLDNTSVKKSADGFLWVYKDNKPLADVRFVYTNLSKDYILHVYYPYADDFRKEIYEYILFVPTTLEYSDFVLNPAVTYGLPSDNFKTFDAGEVDSWESIANE